MSVFVFGHPVREWTHVPALRLRGLIPDALYRDEAGNTHTGEALMKVGLRVSLSGDYDSRFLHFAEV